MSDSIFTGEFFVPGEAPRRLEQDHLARYAFAARYVDGKRVLDIACGSGYGTRALRDAGAVTADGVDLSPEVVDFARQKYVRDGIIYHCDSIYTFKAEQPYDVIVSYETIEHVDDHQKALSNLYQLLADDGVLLISSPNRFITSPKAENLADKPANPYHVMEFNRDEFVAALQAAGFRVDPAEVFGQRLQPRIESRFLRKLYRKLFRPHLNKDPQVAALNGLEPRYFIAVARK